MKNEQLEQVAISFVAGMQALLDTKADSPEYYELLAKITAAKEEYDVKTRFADMANKYQKEKAAGTPPHLIEP